MAEEAIWQPMIETQRLILRRPSILDVDAFERLWADPEVSLYLPRRKALTRQQVETGVAQFIDHWDQHRYGVWSVIQRGSGAWIGYCGLRQAISHHEQETELLYGIDKPWWNQGLTTEAARAVISYAFDELQLAAIFARALPGNRASMRVMEHIGMVREGMDAGMVRYGVSRDVGPSDSYRALSM